MKTRKQYLHIFAVIGLLAGMLFGALGIRPAAAATVLGPGDIAIVGFSFHPSNNFAFVLLVDIETGTQIRFTDAGWTGDNEFFSGEGAVTYTAPGDLPAGTVISYLGSSSDFEITVEGPFTLTGGVAFTNAGDQLLAFQGTYNDPTFLYALNNSSSSSDWMPTSMNAQTTFLPPGLTDGYTAISLDGSNWNGVYNGPLTGTREELLAAISNPDNWTYTKSGVTMPSGSFVVDPGYPEVVSTTPEPNAVNVLRFDPILIQFDEDVEVDEGWFVIVCNLSGILTASVSGGPQEYTLEPDDPFVLDDDCTVTVKADLVTDFDDTPKNMLVDYVWSFSVLKSEDLNVGFSSNTPVLIGEWAEFTNTTTGDGPISYSWDFDDGSGLSTDTDPQHLYEFPGTYQVTLTASNEHGQDSVTYPFVVLSELLTVDKAVIPDRDVPLGGEVTYTITLTKSGETDAEDVSLEDVLPASLVEVELAVGSEGEYDADTHTLTWSGTVPGDDEIVIVFTASVDDDLDLLGTNIVNTASATWGAAAPGSDTASFTVADPSPASLSISKEVDAVEAVELGGQVTYTITLSNSGQSPAEDVSLVDVLPASLVEVELAVGSAGEYDPHTHTLTWSGTVPRLEDVVVEFTATVDDDLDLLGTNIVNTASYTWGADPVSDTASFAVADPSPASLSISKQVDAVEPVELGGQVTYTITLSNSGQSDAEDVSLEDVLPTGLVDVELAVGSEGEYDPDTHTLTWSGIIPGADEIVIVFTARIDEVADLYGTEILNTASFEWGDISDSDTASITVESSPIVPSPALLTISKSVTPDQKVALGGQVTYTITLTNHGDTEAMNVVMTDILPVPLTVLSVQGGGTATGNTVSWTGSILGNSSKTIVFTASLSSSTSLFGQSVSNTVAFTSANAGDGQTSVSFRVTDMPKVYLPVVTNP
jgi:uncharacterized repeat protein (TIGR01451 family)